MGILRNHGARGKEGEGEGGRRGEEEGDKIQFQVFLTITPFLSCHTHPPHLVPNVRFNLFGDVTAVTPRNGHPTTYHTMLLSGCDRCGYNM